MQPLVIKNNSAFVDRVAEMEKLQSIALADEASIIIMYGRRGIGKTELLERSYA